MENEKDEKNLKGLSKAIYILAKIGKIMVTIAIPFMVVAMILMGIVMEKIEYRENTIYFDNEKVVTLNETINGIEFDFNNDFNGKGILSITTQGMDDISEGLEIKKFLDNNKIGKITLFIELSFAFVIVTLVVSRMILAHLEKLFKNIYEKSPFTDENTKHIYMIARLMLLNICISIIMSIVLGLITKNEIKFNIGSYTVMETLILFSVYYIFKYGTNLQSKSKQEIYGSK